MRDDFQPTVYLLASHRNGTLYTGVTSNLMHRLHQHRTGAIKGFTTDHGIARLMWFEQRGSMESAILREKQVKKWNRQWRIGLFAANNPDWRDLAVDLGVDVLPSRRVVARATNCHPRESGDPSPAGRSGDGSPLSRG